MPSSSVHVCARKQVANMSPSSSLFRWRASAHIPPHRHDNGGQWLPRVEARVWFAGTFFTRGVSATRETILEGARIQGKGRMINIRRLYCVKTALGVPLSERYGTRENRPLGSEQYPRVLRLGLQREWDGRRGGHRGALAQRTPTTVLTGSAASRQPRVASCPPCGFDHWFGRQRNLAEPPGQHCGNSGCLRIDFALQIALKIARQFHCSLLLLSLRGTM